MPPALEAERALLRTIIRSIDKNADFNVTLQEGDRPAVEVSLLVRKQKVSVLIPVSSFEGAEENSMRRSELRTTIKRAIDRATFEPKSIASTKMVRGTVVEGGFFRPPQGGRGGRR